MNLLKRIFNKALSFSGLEANKEEAAASAPSVMILSMDQRRKIIRVHNGLLAITATDDGTLSPNILCILRKGQSELAELCDALNAADLDTDPR